MCSADHLSQLSDAELLDELRRRNQRLREHVEAVMPPGAEALLTEADRLDDVIRESRRRLANPH